MKFSKRLYNSFNSLSLIACRIAPTSSTNFPIFTNPFKFFQILTFRFFCVLGRINQRHIVCCCRPSFTRCRGRVSYFVMSVPGKFKPEIADCCFCSHCFYLLALPGKRPIVVISCHKNTVNILIAKNFIFHFVFAAKKIFPIRRNVVPGTIKTISFVYRSIQQRPHQLCVPNFLTLPISPGLGSVCNVFGYASSVL